MSSVELEGVSKVFPGGVEAVRDVDLRVEPGEMVVLVGPSGCGKSTTLRMIAGLEEPTAGTIRIGDRVVNGVAPKDRDIAMVFQSYALYPHMTVRKNLAFGLRMRRTPRREIEPRVSETARLLEIDALLDRKPAALSGGQRQRVALGRAIVREPACFLLDEPLSNLDARLRIETRAELKRLHQRLGTTTVYVTHDQEEAMTLGQRVVVMDQGRIQQCASPLEVYQRPANRFVAGFLGMPPMNFLDGQLVRDARGVRFTGGGLDAPLPEPMAGRLEAHLDGEPAMAAVLGLRPEVLRLRANGPNDHPLRGRLTVAEPLGSAMDLHAMIGDDVRVVARVPAEPIDAHGQPVTLHVDMAAAHVFAPGAHGPNLAMMDERTASPSAHQ